MALFTIVVVYAIALRQTLSAETYDAYLLDPAFGMAAFTSGFLGYVFYSWSLYLLAKGKGYSGWFALLAIGSIIGLLILVFLPDRYRANSR